MKKLLLILVLLIMYMGLIADKAPLWMRYPSISPDGNSIAFSYKDDIYKVSTNGGLAVQLTTHTGYDFKPVWSPDSKKIAFSSDRFGNFDVFIIPSDGGEARRLTYNSSAQTPNCFSNDGKSVIFSAAMDDHYKNVQFPSGILSELYKVSIYGGRVKQIITTPAEEAKIDSTENLIIYQDRKGYENVWRKHHTSSVTKDIWIYNKKTKKHKKLTGFKGEDRSPVFTKNEKGVFYLSEQKGSFNVFALSLKDPSNIIQHTFHEKHPVRFLSIAGDTICYGYNGEIYIKKNKNKPQKIEVKIRSGAKSNDISYKKLSSGATEMAVSPDGKEIAFIVRGEVFVTAVNYSTTKRITNTPEQERSVSFSPDGRSLLYASERDGSWNLFKTELQKDDLNFTSSIVLNEKPVLISDKETFQPQFSPDGKEVAYLEERTTLKVINLKSKKTRTILPAKYNYSYADGDQWYQWSPDGKWFLVQFLSEGRWSYECGLINSNGKQKLVNLTKSGYEDYIPKWSQDGKMMLWYSNKYGMGNIFGMFFTKDAYDKFRLSKEEYELLKEREKRNKKNLDKKKKDKKGEKKDKDKKDKKPELLKIDLKNIQNRIIRLTINSSNLSDGVMSKKYFNKENPIGKTLFFSGFKTDLKITGVLKDIPPNSSMNFNFLISSNSTKLRNHWDDSTTIIKIKKDTDIKKINLKLSKFVIDFLPEMNQKKEILYLKPFLDTHLKSEGIMGPFIWNSPVQFYLILIVSIALLIIVSVNFANLATAKYYNRAKEVGVRKSSGAHRGQLIFQFLSESVILAFLGLPIAMALYELIRPAFIAFIGVDIRLSLLESPGLILILFIMTLLLGLVSGIYPAFFLSSFQPAEVLKKNLKSGTQGASARKALVVFQFLISIVLIIFTFIVIKQFNFLHKVDLGLDRENVISIPISNEIENKIKILKEELIASPKLSMHHTHHGIHLTGMMNMK